MAQVRDRRIVCVDRQRRYLKTIPLRAGSGGVRAGTWAGDDDCTVAPYEYHFHLSRGHRCRRELWRGPVYATLVATAPGPHHRRTQSYPISRIRTPFYVSIKIILYGVRSLVRVHTYIYIYYCSTIMLIIIARLRHRTHAPAQFDVFLTDAFDFYAE